MRALQPAGPGSALAPRDPTGLAARFSRDLTTSRPSRCFHLHFVVAVEFASPCVLLGFWSAECRPLLGRAARTPLLPCQRRKRPQRRTNPAEGLPGEGRRVCDLVKFWLEYGQMAFSIVLAPEAIEDLRIVESARQGGRASCDGKSSSTRAAEGEQEPDQALAGAVSPAVPAPSGRSSKSFTMSLARPSRCSPS